MSKEVKVPQLGLTTPPPHKCHCHLQNSSLYFSERGLPALLSAVPSWQRATASLVSPAQLAGVRDARLALGWGRKGRATIDHRFSEVSNTCFRRENIFFIHLHLDSKGLPTRQLCPQMLPPQSQEARSQGPLPLFWCVV